MVEMVTGLSVLALIGMLGYSMMLSSMNLLVKGVALNSSNTALRNGLDKLFVEINQAYGMPTLVNEDLTSAGSNGPAPGVIFDRYVGGPYVVTNTSGGAGLAATATSFLLKAWMDPLTAPPTPGPDDVVLIGTRRLRVQSCSIMDLGSGDGVRTFRVTLPSQVGSGGISWDSSTKQLAYLLHRKAFVVASANGRAELRLYNNAETDTSNFVVLARGLSARPEETTPFSIANKNGSPFLNVGLRAEDQEFGNYLSSRQQNDFNTFLRVDTSLRPRNKVH
jgi:hypothetical protein